MPKEIKIEVDIYQYPRNKCEIKALSRKDEITVGDIHANPIMFLWSLLYHNIIEMSENDFKRAVELYSAADLYGLFDKNVQIIPEKVQKIRSNFEEFNTIINKIKIINHPLYRLSGELAGFGKCDIYTIYIFLKLLKEKLPLEVPFSKNSAMFLIAYDKLVAAKMKINANTPGMKNDLTNNIYRDAVSLLYTGASQSYTSAHNFFLLLQAEIIPLNILEEFVEEYYKVLKIVSYTVEKETTVDTKGEFISYKHNLTGLETDKALAIFYKVGAELEKEKEVKTGGKDEKYKSKYIAYSENTIDHLKTIYEKINQRFIDFVKDKDIDETIKIINYDGKNIHPVTRFALYDSSVEKLQLVPEGRQYNYRVVCGNFNGKINDIYNLYVSSLYSRLAINSVTNKGTYIAMYAENCLLKKEMELSALKNVSNSNGKKEVNKKPTHIIDIDKYLDDLRLVREQFENTNKIKELNFINQNLKIYHGPLLSKYQGLQKSSDDIERKELQKYFDVFIKNTKLQLDRQISIIEKLKNYNCGAKEKLDFTFEEVSLLKNNEDEPLWKLIQADQKYLRQFNTEFDEKHATEYLKAWLKESYEGLNKTHQELMATMPKEVKYNFLFKFTHRLEPKINPLIKEIKDNMALILKFENLLSGKEIVFEKKDFDLLYSKESNLKNFIIKNKEYLPISFQLDEQKYLKEQKDDKEEVIHFSGNTM